MNLHRALHPLRYTPSDSPVDLLIATCGFEDRSSKVLTEVPFKTAVAYSYADRQVLSFSANVSKFRSHEIPIIEGNGTSVLDDLATRVGLLKNKEKPHVVLDISSMSRTRMAEILGYLLFNLPTDTTLSLIYFLAEYHSPPNSQPSFAEIGPISKQFAGWAPEPDWPVTTVIGLGYERDKAIGINELLEAGMDNCWLFLPEGDEPEYMQDLLDANDALLKYANSEKVINYAVREPLHLLASLESLISGLVRKSRVVLVPMGPKIFSGCAILASARLDYSVPVWSVTTGQNEEPVQAIAKLPAIGISVRVGPVAEHDQN